MRPQCWDLSVVCCSVGLVCCLWGVGVAQSTSTASPSPQHLGDMWLEGNVGGEAIRAYIGDAGWPKSSGLWGAYYFTKNWSAIPLDGDWTAPGRVRLTEGVAGDAGAKRRFDLNISQPGAVEGTWTSADGARVLPVRLRRVPKPAPFEVAIRRPRQFADSKWPMRLSYPDGWRLDVSSTELTLRSPDPLDTLFDNELHCVRGGGVPSPPRPGDPPVEFSRPFFRGDSGWLVAAGLSADCTTAACQPPESRATEAGVFLKSSVEYRSHGPWGYMGLAEASVYLIVVEQTWVRCTDRLLDVDTRISVAGRPKRTP